MDGGDSEAFQARVFARLPSVKDLNFVIGQKNKGII